MFGWAPTSLRDRAQSVDTKATPAEVKLVLPELRGVPDGKLSEWISGRALLPIINAHRAKMVTNTASPQQAKLALPELTHMPDETVSDLLSSGRLLSALNARSALSDCDHQFESTSCNELREAKDVDEINYIKEQATYLDPIAEHDEGRRALADQIRDKQESIACLKADSLSTQDQEQEVAALTEKAADLEAARKQEAARRLERNWTRFCTDTKLEVVKKPKMSDERKISWILHRAESRSEDIKPTLGHYPAFRNLFMRIFTMRESNKPATSLNLFTKYVKARKDDFADEDWPATEHKLPFHLQQKIKADDPSYNLPAPPEPVCLTCGEKLEGAPGPYCSMGCTVCACGERNWKKSKAPNPFYLELHQPEEFDESLAMVELWNCQACKRNFGPSEAKLAKLAGPGGQPAGLTARPVTEEVERMRGAEGEVVLAEIPRRLIKL